MALTRADITIRHDRREGDDDLIVALHRDGYAHEGPAFGPAFFPFVAKTVAEAQLGDNKNNRVWFAEAGRRTLGCAAMIDRGDRGQLRWVIVLPEARAFGLGKQLVTLALAHAETLGCREVFLETTDGLDASMKLYERLGFEVRERTMAELWQGPAPLVIMTKTLHA